MQHKTEKQLAKETLPKKNPLKIRSDMLAMDEYMRVFILPQIPSGYKEYRDALRETTDKAWRELYYALFTSKRERQRHLLALKVEMSLIEVYLREVRDVCYRGKEKKRLDQNSAKRFEVMASNYKAVMDIVWAWIKNENDRMPTENTQRLAGLTETE